MDIKNIENILNEALKETDNLKLKKDYGEAITEYLEEHKSTDEVITIVTKGFSIDQGANYYEFLESMPKEEYTGVWKQIKKNKTIKSNINNNGLRFVAGIFAMALMNESILESQKHHMLSLMMDIVNAEKEKNGNKSYELILKEVFVDYFPHNYSFPIWEKISAMGKCQKEFAQIILDIIQDQPEKEYVGIRYWASEGLKSAEAQIEKEKIESRIPKSRIEDLQSIVEHYKAVEKQVKKDVYELARLEKNVNNLQQDINRLQKEKGELCSQIETLKQKHQNLQNKLEKAERTISEHKAINDSFSSVKKHEEEALLKEIADEISAEYRDFKDSQYDEMDVVLGEIYREKLRNVFKILERKGITME